MTDWSFHIVAITVFEIEDADGLGKMYPRTIAAERAAVAVPPPWRAVAGHVVTDDNRVFEWDVRVMAGDLSGVTLVGAFDFGGSRAVVSDQAITFVDSATLGPECLDLVRDLPLDARRYAFAPPTTVPFVEQLFGLDQDSPPHTESEWQFAALVRLLGLDAVRAGLHRDDDSVSPEDARASFVDEETGLPLLVISHREVGFRDPDRRLVTLPAAVAQKIVEFLSPGFGQAGTIV